MSFFKVNTKCNGCLACIQNCPAGALKYIDNNHERSIHHNITRCARCAHCWRVCPQQAIEFQHLLTSEWDNVVSLDLVHCTICGEPLYTTNFGDAVNDRLSENIHPLCPAHKKSNVAQMWKHKTVK